MSEHTYCDRCGMEITGERHCMGEGGTGPIFPWFHPKFDLCGGCFRDWKNWLPRSVSTLDEKCDEGQKEAELVKATEWVELNGYWRISTDGTRVQRRDWCDDSDPWVDTKDSPPLVELYRAGLTHGREVAEAENAALREQVKAVEWVVRTAQDVDRAAVHSEKPYYDLVHAYAIESLHAALAEFSNPEVQL